MFPSNIQGLPTWYEIRVDKHGYTARTPHFDLMVALNPATYQKDVQEVRPGGWLLYDSTWPLDQRLTRPDVTYLGIPLAELCNAAFKGPRERILMKNIAYAGALAALLDMDTEIIRALLTEKYSRKPALMDSNRQAVDLGYNYVQEHFDCPLPIRLEAMDETKDSILIDGNTAAGARLRVCRRDGRRLVSDHPGDVADGGVHELLPKVPPRSGDEEEQVRDPAGRGRDCRSRHGDRRELGRARARSRRRPVPASR